MLPRSGSRVQRQEAWRARARPPADRTGGPRPCWPAVHSSRLQPKRRRCTRRRRSKGRAWNWTLWRCVKVGRPAVVRSAGGGAQERYLRPDSAICVRRIVLPPSRALRATRSLWAACAPHRRWDGSYSGRHETPSCASSSMSTAISVRSELGEIPEISLVREMVFSS